ncbi:hypothetical protein GJ496_010104 [Pomphorhynchus laevis]|nr:hypothetical protein GJ496_010104 [Pomphorhynchus laevis]
MHQKDRKCFDEYAVFGDIRYRYSGMRSRDKELQKYTQGIINHDDKLVNHNRYLSDYLLKYADDILNCSNQEQVDREERRKLLRIAQQEATIHNIKTVQSCNEKLNESGNRMVCAQDKLERLTSLVSIMKIRTIECIGELERILNHQSLFTALLQSLHVEVTMYERIYQLCMLLTNDITSAVVLIRTWLPSVNLGPYMRNDCVDHHLGRLSHRQEVNDDGADEDEDKEKMKEKVNSDEDPVNEDICAYKEMYEFLGFYRNTNPVSPEQKIAFTKHAIKKMDCLTSYSNTHIDMWKCQILRDVRRSDRLLFAACETFNKTDKFADDSRQALVKQSQELSEKLINIIDECARRQPDLMAWSNAKESKWSFVENAYLQGSLAADSERINSTMRDLEQVEMLLRTQVWHLINDHDQLSKLSKFHKKINDVLMVVIKKRQVINSIFDLQNDLKKDDLPNVEDGKETADDQEQKITIQPLYEYPQSSSDRSPFLPEN